MDWQDMDPVSLFKALADATRLRCIGLLANYDELCVCELTQALDLPQPKISHHLAALRKSGLVSDRKQGLWIYYRLNPELPSWAVKVIDSAVEGTSNRKPYANDLRQMELLSSSENGICLS